MRYFKKKKGFQKVSAAGSKSSIGLLFLMTFAGKQLKQLETHFIWLYAV
jgi:hypothetical protein